MGAESVNGYKISLDFFLVNERCILIQMCHWVFSCITISIWEDELPSLDRIS